MTDTNSITIKLETFKQSYVDRDIWSQCIATFKLLRENKKLGGEQLCMLITGDTGVGKTSLLKHYELMVANELNNPKDIPAVLISRIPANPNIETTVLELLKDLGDFGTAYRLKDKKALNLIEALIKLLIKKKTELIIIDEFQELIENASVSNQAEIGNRLKQISESSGVPIALIGMPWAARIAEDPQWASRLMFRKQLDYFKIIDKEKRSEYINFLVSLSRELPFERKTNLGVKEYAFPLFSATCGEPRKLKNLILFATKIALENGDLQLTKAHLSQFYRSLYQNETNPFELELNDIEISEVSEYSKHNRHVKDASEAITPTKFTDKLTISQILKK
ncbi:putative transposition protein [Moritella sp. PE36]|uniref:TniB family NTP-binding protein n=1 Tax=Moritella sp. PE36 TaxID=58051 RepID=UPI0001569180|nr:TniB family NTP-binding protein [Moritella sp. PE36]EDM65299.1 putative transposition protein [Moritella sp. PE36]